MFTGIIEDIGTLVGIRRSGRTANLTIQTALPPEEFTAGDSLAVNGTCLTIEKISGNSVSCHCLAETLSRTNLGSLASGDKVNLERALLVGGRMGGHFVTGHVDFTSRIISSEIVRDDLEVTVEIPDGQQKFFVEKGSVALDGISLTIARITVDSFTICMIPHTAKFTTLASKKTGDMINVETDILGKYILRATSTSAESDQHLLNKLKEYGF